MSGHVPEITEITRRALTLGALAAVAGVAGVAARGDGVAPGPDVRVAGAGGAAARADGGPPARATVRTPTASPPPSVTPAPRALLPRGGRTLFPRYRIVAYAGLPGVPTLGRLGIGDLDARTAELDGITSRYATGGRQPLPALELISVVAQSKPGADGRYRVRVDPEVVGAHLAAARRREALLLLNIQPGKAAFLDEVRAHERWLREPEVGLALDPEWAVRGRARPGQVFGSATGRELDGVSAWLADLVARHDLPEKLMVVHVLAPRVVRDLRPLRRRPGVRVVRCADGIGTVAEKRSSWRHVQGVPTTAAGRAASGPGVMSTGFKLFFVEDERGASRLMTPAEVLALRPAPDYVCYE